MKPLIEKLNAMWVGFIKALPNLGLALFVLIITLIATHISIKILRAFLSRANIRRSLLDFFVTMTKVTMWTLGILVAMTVIFPSLTPAKLLTALGLGSIAVGLAFKDIFENFMSGAMIMLRKPMRIGDYIECESVKGTVELITMRDTYLRQLDDILVLVPNSYIFKNPVFVLTDNVLRRFEIICGVAYGEDADEARRVIQQAVMQLDIIENSKPVDVFAREFNSSSIDYTVRWWAKSSPIDMHKSRDEVVRAIKRALDEAGIEIPFPYRTLTFKQPLRINQQDIEEGGQE